jgi:hypothetical protein
MADADEQRTGTRTGVIMLDFTTRLIIFRAAPAFAVGRVLGALNAASRGSRSSTFTAVVRGEHTPELPGQPGGAYTVFDLVTKPSAVGEHDKFIDAARQALIDYKVPYAWCSGSGTWQSWPS